MSGLRVTLRSALVGLFAPAVALAADPEPAAVTPAAEPPAPAADAPPPPPPPTDVLVVGTKEGRTGGSGLIIKSKQLERFEHDDPHQVLLSSPGVYVRQEDGFGLRPNVGMRGAATDRSKKVTLMEDGVLFAPAPYSAPAAYYFPLITRMTSVRVLKGPSAILHGPHTVGGAIDLVTAPIPDSGKGMVDLALGRFGYKKAHARGGVSDETWGALVEGVHVSSTGFKEIDGVGGDTGFSRNEWMGKLRRSLPPLSGMTHELELKAGYSSEVSRETYLGLSDADFRADPDRRYAATQRDEMRWTRTALALTHKATMVDGLEVRTTVYRSDFDRTWNRVQGMRQVDLYSALKNPRTELDHLAVSELRGETASIGGADTLLVGPNHRVFSASGVQVAVRGDGRTGPIRHAVQQGLRLHHDDIAREHTQEGYSIDGASLVPLGTGVETTARNEASSDALALYLMDAMTWWRLTMTVGARVETIRGRFVDHLTGTETRLGQRVVLPGAGLFGAITQDLGVFGGVHEGFTPAPPTDQTDVRPERSTNTEVGVRWAPRKFRAEIIGFWNAYRNLTSLCTFSSGCAQDGIDRQFNGGKARIRGVEVYVESELPAGRGWSVPGRLAYTFTDARFLSTFSSSDPTFADVRSGDQLPYVPRQQLTASVGVERRNLGLHLAYTQIGRMREAAGQGTASSDLVTDQVRQIDASASYKPRTGLTLYVNGRNLTDQRALVARRPFGARPSAPMTVQAGVKAEF